MHRRNKKANQFLYSSCFQKRTSFVLYFCLARFAFFSVFDENKGRGKKIGKILRAHTESSGWRRRKKNRNNNLNVSCAFSIHLYAMHFSKCFSQKKSTTLLKSIEQSFHIEVHFSFVRSLIRLFAAFNTTVQIHFHGFQMQSTKDGFQIIKESTQYTCVCIHINICVYSSVYTIRAHKW